MSNVYRVIDTDYGTIAICDSYDNAYKICKDYCEKTYDAMPEEVEEVWIEETELNTWLI